MKSILLKTVSVFIPSQMGMAVAKFLFCHDGLDFGHTQRFVVDTEFIN